SREVGRATLADKAQVLVALLVVRDGQHGAVRTQPFGKQDTVSGSAAFRPIGGISAAESIHRVLHAAETKVVGKDLDNQKHDVDIVEEAQIDMLHAECLGLGSRFWKAHPDLGDVGATEHSKR